MLSSVLLNLVCIGTASQDYETSDADDDYESVLDVYVAGRALNVQASPTLTKLLSYVNL